MFRILPPLLVALLACSYTIGQDLSWKKHKKTAEQLFAQGKYIEAANHFEKAWKKKPDNNALIYQAGECYALLKDFKKASLAYQQVKDEDFELVGLKYARALKQDGQYESAKRAFLDFSNGYTGKDKTLLNQLISTEIKGTELGMRLSNNAADTRISVHHLNEQINSLKTEIAPIPFAENLLYFSSTRKNDKAFLYRSQKQKGKWSKAVAAENLPNIEDKHLANGTFTPDAKRFYFTLCEDNSQGNGLVSICKIYSIERKNSGWTEPISLRDYINEEGATTTQPFVIHQNGLERLFFVSNRKGGKGGMDIWMTTREINSGDVDFTYPVNLGKQINSIGDEVTPFYDTKAGILYFSSNGHTSIGGWDVFRAEGVDRKWKHPENMGMPINSSADDFYYTLKPSRKGGFLVSNRIAGPEKISTQHEDIFEFGPVAKQSALIISGEIMDRESTADLQQAHLSLYEVRNGQERLLQHKKSNANDYHFKILPNRNYRLTVEVAAYTKEVFDFNTLQYKKAIQHDFYLNKSAVSAVPVVTQATSTNTAQPPKVLRTTTSVPTRTVSPPPNKPTTKPATYNRPPLKPAQGTYYKVQLIAINTYNAQHPRYKNIKQLAPIETESVPNNPKITRVLLASFSDKQQARTAMQQARQYGFFDAFMVKYQNGNRLGMVYD